MDAAWSPESAVSLPNSIDSSTPLGSDPANTIDDVLREIATFLVDVFGIPNNTAIAAAGRRSQAPGSRA